MSDTYGGLPIPAPAPTNPPTPSAAGDPLLGWTADFVKAVLNANAPLAWNAVAPNTPVVKTVFLHDPRPEVFNERDLPALFVYRDEGHVADELEWTADDYRFERGQIVLLWIPPTATQDKRAIRAPIVNAIGKVLDLAIERGRDPAWIVTGDTDPQAASKGSVLATWAGWASFGVKAIRRATITIPKGVDKATYEAVAIGCYVEELAVEDITKFDALAGVDATFKSPDQGTGLGDFVLGEEIYD